MSEDALARLLAASAAEEEEGDQPLRRAGVAERALVKALNSACRVSRLHEIENSVTQGVLQEFAQLLGEYLDDPANRQLAVVQGNGRFSVNGAAIKLKRHGRSWINDWLDFMQRMGIGALVFSGSWRPEHCTQLLHCFRSSDARDPEGRALAVAAAARERIEPPAELRLLTPQQAEELAAEDAAEERSARERSVFLYARLVALAEASVGSVRVGRSPDFQGRHLRSTLMSLIEELREGRADVPLLALSALPHRPREPYASHLANTALLALAAARLLGLPRGHLIDLGFAAFYHDLGRALLGLDAFQAEAGAALDASDRPRQLSVACALRGRGYGSTGLARLAAAEEQARVRQPGLPSAGLPRPHPFSRLIAVAAEFDQRCNGTPWQPPSSPARVLAELSADPRFGAVEVGLLRDTLGERPRGTLLRLEGGELALVVDGGARSGRARVRRPAQGGQVEALPPEARVSVVEPGGVALDWRAALLD